MCARVRKDPEDRGSVRRGRSGARAIRAWAVMNECQGFARSILDSYIYVVYIERRQPVLGTVHSTAHARARESKAPNCFGKLDRGGDSPLEFPQGPPQLPEAAVR